MKITNKFKQSIEVVIDKKYGPEMGMIEIRVSDGDQYFYGNGVYINLTEKCALQFADGIKAAVKSIKKKA